MYCTMQQYIVYLHINLTQITYFLKHKIYESNFNHQY